MSRWIAVWLLMISSLAAQGDRLEKIELRVTGEAAGLGAIIDRGETDGLKKGDLVTLRPRNGRILKGNIVRISGRSAVVDLRGQPMPTPGTRGDVLVPASRFADPEPEPEKPAAKPAQPTQGQERIWKRRDDYRDGQPLLSNLAPTRPERRPMRISGRYYMTADVLSSTNDDFRNSWARGGVDGVAENPFGEGGTIDFDAGLLYETDEDEQGAIEPLIRRLSYRRGGTRFEPAGWQAGRFLQTGMPEFGILDGVEWFKRRENGDRFGASFGFMPEPDHDEESFEDLQFGAFYEWVADNSERLAFAAGIQKTFHDGDTDRDLVVVKGRYLPVDDWQFNGTLWIDFYLDDDQVKEGVSLTQAWLSASRRYQDGSGLEFVYRRIEFPELDRREFRPILPQRLQEAAFDRLSMRGWTRVAPQTMLRTELGGFSDEDFTGGYGEVGTTIDEFLLEDDIFEFTLYGDAGRHVSTVGVRASYGRFMERGRWDVIYDGANNRHLGFDSDFDDVANHMLSASYSLTSESGWTFSVHADALYWGDDSAFGAGFFWQRAF